MDGLLIGRFQPFHLGHLHALEFALSCVDNLWIGIGSSNKPRDRSNPFSVEERKEMILTSINDAMAQKISLYPMPDFNNHAKWIEMIDLTVPKFEAVFSNDHITRHLYAKKNVKVIPIVFLKRDILSGTHIRNLIADDKDWAKLVPDGTHNVIHKYYDSCTKYIRSFSNFK